jgi:hypothetical protein
MAQQIKDKKYNSYNRDQEVISSKCPEDMSRKTECNAIVFLIPDKRESRGEAPVILPRSIALHN